MDRASIQGLAAAFKILREVAIEAIGDPPTPGRWKLGDDPKLKFGVDRFESFEKSWNQLLAGGGEGELYRVTQSDPKANL